MSFIPTETGHRVTGKLIGSDNEDDIKAEMNDVLTEIMNILTNPILVSLSSLSSIPLCSNVPFLADLDTVNEIIDQGDEQVLTFSFELIISGQPCSMFLFFPTGIFEK